jgi:prepilin-type N-terminal cleavage/methylation domain-containing protein
MQARIRSAVRPGGYTLVELLLVLALLGIALAVVAVSVTQLVGRVQERSFVADFQHSLQRLQARAQLQNRIVVASVDFQQGRLLERTPEGWSVWLALEEPHRFEAIPDRPLNPNDTPRPPGPLTLMFFPDGQTTDAQFVLRAHAAQAWHVQLHGASGRMQMQPWQDGEQVSAAAAR